MTPHMIFAQTDGIVSVLLDHTCTRGPSVTRMWDFYVLLLLSTHIEIFSVSRKRDCGLWFVPFVSLEERVTFS